MDKNLQKLKLLLLSLAALFFLGGSPEELKADWEAKFVDGRWDDYYCDENGNIIYDFVGVLESPYNSSDLVYVQDGKINYHYTGLAYYNNKIISIRNGHYFRFDGIILNDEIANPEFADSYSGDSISYWYVIDGYVVEDFTGWEFSLDFLKADWIEEDFELEDVNPTKVFYFNKGVWDRNFSGIVKKTNEDGSWQYRVIKNGILESYTGFSEKVPGVYFYNGISSSSYDGFREIDGKKYYFVDGKVFDHTGLVCIENYGSGDAYFYIENGCLKEDHPTTLIKYEGDWWYVEEGCVNSTYTGLFQYNGIWWYIKEGKIDWNYTGLAYYNESNWYVKNGQIDWKYVGAVKSGNSWYEVKNGKATFLHCGDNGFYEKNGQHYYYVKGKLYDHTGIVYDEYARNWKYLEKGHWNRHIDTLTKYNGIWWYVEWGQVDFNYTGLFQYNGTWWYIKNGQIDWKYKGLVKYNGSWWYVENGQINWKHSGLVKYGGSWWYVKEGQLRFGYTGLAKNSAGWFHVIKGQVKFGYTGLSQYTNGWWYMKNGAIQFSYTGLVQHSGTWYYVSGGKLNWNAAGLCKYGGSWWYVRGGILRFDYTGLAKNSAGWFHVIDGKVKFGYTGMTSNENGWWYMRNGKIDFSYTGLGTNESGTWYYKNGRIQFGYSGRAYVGNVPYRIDFGQAKRIYIPNNYLTKENTEYRIMEIAYRTGDYSKLTEYQMQFAKGLFNCLDAAYCYTSDWEREKAVFDYLCKYVKYDYSTYFAVLGKEGFKINRDSANVVGTFRDGLAVCDGYAKAFQYAMSMLGIPCERVVGSSRDSGEGHAWNRVQIGGKWYQVDVTWADHLEKDGSGNIYYTYFNITDEQMLENHVYRITDSTNKCTSTEHSYKAYLLKYEKDKYCKTEAEVLAYIEKKLSESKGNITIECYAAGNVYFNGKYFNFSSLMNNHKLQNVYGVKDVKVDKYVINGREIITFKFTLKRN